MLQKVINGLTIFYRISDNGNPKNKVEYVTNKNCLLNFLKEFPPDKIVMIADHVSDDTHDWLNNFSFKRLVRTNAGNAGSFWFAFKQALIMPDDEYIYFVENDYIHKPNSLKVLLEGLQISDYVTLYDHPDKYVDGINPCVKNGGEKCKVLMTESTHWKSTNSTTMTFASKVRTLKKDKYFFKLFTNDLTQLTFPFLRKYLASSNPHDFWLFMALTRLKRRRLISPLPSYSTHGEKAFIAPIIHWESIINLNDH